MTNELIIEYGLVDHLDVYVSQAKVGSCIEVIMVTPCM